MKLLLSLVLFVTFTVQFSNSALGLVWINSVTETSPPSTDCTVSSLTVSGDLSATHTFSSAPVVVTGTNITISVQYTSGIGLPVITPFTHNVSLGIIPAGTYTVTTYGVLDGQIQSTVITTLLVTACCGTTADFSYPTSICLGETISLTNTSTGSIAQEWFEDGASASLTVNHSLTPAVVGNVLIKLVTTDGTCEDSVEYTINVLGVVSISSITPSATTLCQGETLTITHTSQNATDYLWAENGLPLGTSSSLSTLVTTPGIQVYQLIATNGACSDSMETTITVNPAPTIDFMNVSETSICLGASIDLISSSTGATSVVWYENGSFLTNGANLTTTPATDGIFTYQLVVGNGNCEDSMDLVVSVTPYPTIDSFTASHSILCIGDTVQFTSSSANGTSFEWLENSFFVANGPNYSATPTQEGTYSYQLLVGLNGCNSYMTHDVEVVGLPTVDLGVDTNDCLGPIILDAGSGMSSYLWSDQSTTQTLTPTTTGTYSVLVTDANGCSNSDELFFQSCANISELTGMNVIFYPNPVESYARIEIDGFQGMLEIRVTDLNGRLISDHSEHASGIVDVDFRNYKSGVYFIEITTNDASTVLEVIKK